MKKINNLNEIKEDTYFIFKHSAICPVSISADDRINEIEPKIKIPIYKITIQENRALSNEVAKKYNIQHESPQLILIKEEKAIWNKDHYNINEKEIKEALKNA